MASRDEKMNKYLNGEHPILNPDIPKRSYHFGVQRKEESIKQLRDADKAFWGERK